MSIPRFTPSHTRSRFFRVVCTGLTFISLVSPAPQRTETPLGPSAVWAGALEDRGKRFSAEKRPPWKEYVSRLGIDRWHALGFRGQGVKVAILDSGFRGYRDHLGKTLPSRVTARSFRMDGNLEAKNSQHGILCGEIVHAMAPDAELLFANWEPDSAEQFLNAVRWARDQNARVISCSVISPRWSDGEGGGTVHERLARLLGNGKDSRDMLCFASAGNVAERHWSGRFQDDGTGLHQWQPGRTDNFLTPWGKERVSVELCQQQKASYDIIVVDQTTGLEVAYSRMKGQSGTYTQTSRFMPQAGHRYLVRVRLTAGKPGHFHLFALGSGLEYTTPRGSLCFPGDGPEVLAVGAVNAAGRRMGYSSCGPNSSRPKPDLVAQVPFPSEWRAQPFGGTSAAAPQAAGLAAVCWSHHLDWSADQLRATLLKAAVDLGPPGHDNETGYGLIHLPGEQLAKRPVR